jgi:hypothetical protein
VVRRRKGRPRIVDNWAAGTVRRAGAGCTARGQWCRGWAAWDCIGCPGQARRRAPQHRFPWGMSSDGPPGGGLEGSG